MGKQYSGYQHIMLEPLVPPALQVRQQGPPPPKPSEVSMHCSVTYKTVYDDRLDTVLQNLIKSSMPGVQVSGAEISQICADIRSSRGPEMRAHARHNAVHQIHAAANGGHLATVVGLVAAEFNGSQWEIALSFVSNTGMLSGKVLSSDSAMQAEVQRQLTLALGMTARGNAAREADLKQALNDW